MVRKAVLFTLIAILAQAGQAQTAHLMSASAPSSSAGADDQLPTFHSRAEEVNLIFTATKHGKYLRDLHQSDLTVLDDGKPPEALRNFQSETNLPLRVALVMDASSSITSRFNFEQEAANQFFKQILRPNIDKGLVVTFKSTAHVAQGFSDDATKLANAVNDVSAGGGSAVYDAVNLATKKLMESGDETPVRRVIILITDGEDNQSRITRRQLIDAANHAEVTIYSISSNFSPVQTRGDNVLRQLGDETGGRVFFPGKIENVAHEFKEIEQELRAQYVLSYKPADFVADGRYRRIQITAHNDKNIVVRVRRGYFVPAD
ncbi:MAG TPA: VWA domain-containing protein [Nitrospira sp.]|nr:VWA domain-containing protein [Nitrospira sp.]